jgi:xylulose-5-phosphate/fructose-6-phosphate phosphoketolase
MEHETLDEVFTSNGIVLDTKKLREEHDTELKNIAKYRRLADYLTAAQLYLKDNVFVEQPLKKQHIRERLLGHWGTCPGITFMWSHLSYLIKKQNLNMFCVVGPGHGAAAVYANLLVEGALEACNGDYSADSQGMENLIKSFCWPGGFPSHVNAQFPGCIHEGGELGYSLSVSFGAVMDNPDLIVACIVGDGESETGPMATSWHGYKYLDPKESGAVLPILHLNEFKISSATIYGCCKNEELVFLFNGMGYKVRFVEDMNDMDADMAASLEWAVQEIRVIQQAAREGHPIFKPKWPMLIVRSPKGWGGVKILHGKQIEGSYRSHGIPLQEPNEDQEEFTKLEAWLRSYKVEELMDNGKIDPDILSVLPKESARMGFNKHTNPALTPLNLPNIRDFAVRENDKNGSVLISPTKTIGSYLSEIIQRNPTQFRIFSPDELSSNKLDGVLEVTTRNFQWKEETANKGGRVLEMLSEHTCQGWMQGYSLTGRYALLPSYETFLGIITTMMIQYAKFLKLARQTGWRRQTPSINYLETSTLWRQEHNGYSHQDPMFINNLLNMKSELVRIYFPPDANTFLCVMNKCLTTPQGINLVVSTKAPSPLWLTIEEAVEHCREGVGIWKWLSTDEGRDPDLVVAGCGNETNVEAVAAVHLLKRDFPNLRIRFVNVIDLMRLDLQRQQSNPCALSVSEFENIFTADKPVVFNFHGYPSAIHQLLFGRTKTKRFKVLGYIEEGTTTTPFAMLTTNRASRFHVAMEGLKLLQKCGSLDEATVNPAVADYETQVRNHATYIHCHGRDPDYLSHITASPKTK